MKGNSFGRIFRITTWGESHGRSIGVVIDGCPSNISLQSEDFSFDLGMRQGGSQPHLTARAEPDQIEIESGVFQGKTTGSSISLRIINTNIKSEDYSAFEHIPRPGHADFTTYLKHSHRDHRGGGRSSARETVARVAAGVIAKKILARNNIEILAFLRRLGALEVPEKDLSFHKESSENITVALWEKIKKERLNNPYRLPIVDIKEFQKLMEQTKESKNSIGGSIECWVKGLPTGLGEPIFDKLNAMLAHGIFSLPAITGLEIGGGIAMSKAKGSEIRDPIGKNIVLGNRHGGLLGGMTSGSPLWLQAHFHAPTSIPEPIESVDLRSGANTSVSVGGRHDSAPLPRAVPMVEAMVAIVLCDALALANSL